MHIKIIFFILEPDSADLLRRNYSYEYSFDIKRSVQVSVVTRVQELAESNPCL